MDNEASAPFDHAHRERERERERREREKESADQASDTGGVLLASVSRDACVCVCVCAACTIIEIHVSSWTTLRDFDFKPVLQVKPQPYPCQCGLSKWFAPLDLIVFCERSGFEVAKHGSPSRPSALLIMELAARQVQFEELEKAETGSKFHLRVSRPFFAGSIGRERGKNESTQRTTIHPMVP